MSVNEFRPLVRCIYCESQDNSEHNCPLDQQEPRYSQVSHYDDSIVMHMLDEMLEETNQKASKLTMQTIQESDLPMEATQEPEITMEETQEPVLKIQEAQELELTMKATQDPELTMQEAQEPEIAIQENQSRYTLSKLVKMRSLAASESNEFTCSRCYHDNATVPMCKKQYHVKCITCFICRTSLLGTIPDVYNSQLYCKTHYKQVVKGIECATCCSPIDYTVRPTHALGKYYHPEHLVCEHCNKPIDPYTTGVAQHKKTGKIYCQTDFNEKFFPKCDGCARSIEKETVVSNDGKLKGQWHKFCFKCQHCRNDFPDQKFYAYNNKPYCKTDYYKLNQCTVCPVCNTSIEGECIGTDALVRYHIHCFTCYQCKEQIKDKYYTYEDKLYCVNHTPMI